MGPDVQQTGSEQIVFDWTAASQLCGDQFYIPDNSVRAFRRSDGRVQALIAHIDNRRMIGPDLDHLAPDCRVLMPSHRNADPAAFDDSEWLTSTYTEDGTTVRSLVHDEYHGWEHTGMCPIQGPFARQCWYNAVTSASSTDSGDSFSHAPAPEHVVASLPYQYDPNRTPTDRRYGYFNGSEILKIGSSYYARILAEPFRDQQNGVCLLRTQNLSDPKSWRAWDGTDFTVRFVNPYPTAPQWPARHLCQPVGFDRILRGTSDLSFNTYFNKYLLVNGYVGFDFASNREVSAVWYSTSPDLMEWTQPQLLMEATLPQTYRCGYPNPIGYFALLDPSSTDRNFDVTGRNPYLYFTRFNYANCQQTLDRDVVRIPIRFNKAPQPSFTASPNPALAGKQVTFSAGASSDSDGSITGYQWDLDGDGTFETDTGSTPSATRSYTAIGPRQVGLRVTDDQGHTKTATRMLVVNARVNFQPSAASVPTDYTKDTGAAYSDTTGSGWVQADSLGTPTHTPLDLTPNTRERNVVADQRLDTFILMQYPPYEPAGGVSTTGAWELAVPNGTYTVTVGVGDPRYRPNEPHAHRVNVEGQPAISGFVPTASAPNASASKTVAVTDGRLTLDPVGGTNTALDYVNVDASNAAPVASFTHSPTTVLSKTEIRFDASGSSDPDGSIVKYEWDLDGNGTFEADTGPTPSASSGTIRDLMKYYNTAGPVNVRLRVTDNAGATTTASRQLAVTTKVNFQPYGATRVTDYIRDAGSAYEPSRGYGWVRQDSLSSTHQPLNLTPNARERDVSSDNRVDTFIAMQFPSGRPFEEGEPTPGAWEMAVPNGSYTVTVGAGDPLYSPDEPHRHQLNVEGQAVISGFTPSPGNPTIVATRTVTVTDGRLTIDAIGGTNTSLAFADITPVPHSAPQSASRIGVSLVPSFKQCGTGANPADGEHRAPFANDSCVPPGPASDVAQIGSQSSGSLELAVQPGDGDLTNGDQADVAISASLTDVRTLTGQDYNPSASGPDLTGIVRFRITDRANCSGASCTGPYDNPATTAELDFRMPADCNGTAGSEGATCTANTSADAVTPGLIAENQGAVIQAFRVRVYDSGPNGVRNSGLADDRLLAHQGIFVP